MVCKTWVFRILAGSMLVISANILNTQVLHTILGGEVVYSR
jgi:hypothetical protein